MEYPAYCCDTCGKNKGDTNHWFAVWALNEMEFKVLPWDEAVSTGKKLSKWEHICGQECLHIHRRSPRCGKARVTRVKSRDIPLYLSSSREFI
jgi:hypothetical protein